MVSLAIYVLVWNRPSLGLPHTPKMEKGEAKLRKRTLKFKNIFGRKIKKKDQEIKALIEMFEERTAEFSKEAAFNKLDTEDSWDFILLLKLADQYQLGKSLSILYAYRLGYLEGLKDGRNQVGQDG